VNEILTVIETLHIDPIYLEKSPKLARVVKVYAKNQAKIPQALDQAKRIYDKWSRIFFGISTSFFEGDRIADDDEDTGHDQYRNLRRKLENMKQRSLAAARDDEDEDGGRHRRDRPQLTSAQK